MLSVHQSPENGITTLLAKCWSVEQWIKRAASFTTLEQPLFGTNVSLNSFSSEGYLCMILGIETRAICMLGKTLYH